MNSSLGIEKTVAVLLIQVPEVIVDAVNSIAEMAVLNVAVNAEAACRLIAPSDITVEVFFVALVAVPLMVGSYATRELRPDDPSEVVAPVVVVPSSPGEVAVSPGITDRENSAGEVVVEPFAPYQVGSGNGRTVDFRNRQAVIAVFLTRFELFVISLPVGVMKCRVSVKRG